MSVNKHRPHVLILPEDAANRQIAKGFELHPDIPPRTVQVLPEAGGWRKVLEEFREVHAPEMQRSANRFMILLIDLDGREDRLPEAQSGIPQHLIDRVFLLGAWDEPEPLKRALAGTLEEIGRRMAQDCRDGTEHIWSHELLRHNSAELDRLRVSVRPILFPSRMGP